MNFQDCINSIGQMVYISPCPYKNAFEILRFKNGYITFYYKAGTMEIRYDLNEETIKFYNIYESN